MQSRQKSVETFATAQRTIASSAVEELRSQLRPGGLGILDEFATWTGQLEKAKNMIAECRRYQIAQHQATMRFMALVEQKNKKVASVLQNKIPQAERQMESLSESFATLKKQVEEQTTEIVANRFSTFDRIYVLLMEAQLEFFQRGAEAVKVFERPVANYRKRTPKRSATFLKKIFTDNGFIKD